MMAVGINRSVSSPLRPCFMGWNLCPSGQKFITVVLHRC